MRQSASKKKQQQNSFVLVIYRPISEVTSRHVNDGAKNQAL